MVEEKSVSSPRRLLESNVYKTLAFVLGHVALGSKNADVGKPDNYCFDAYWFSNEKDLEPTVPTTTARD